MLAFVVALSAATLAPSAAQTTEGQSGRQADCAQPPEVFPVDQLRPGMRGSGYTVIEGRDPVRFNVEILGVIPDAIPPGIDFILVETSGRVISQTGGIAFGFSGSPVYIEGKLVGAIAYGFFAADHTIGGITPAEAMLEVLATRPRRCLPPALLLG
ncbi:MAG: hypothetical protein M3N51_03975 [Actinomycetota bacterium]|nr:hypothetical protein [Actinomycetota bacterium]